MLFPSQEEFLALGVEGSLSPVTRELLADFETPLSAYWKLAHDEPYSFLLESVTGGENLARYSILGVRPRLVLRSKGSKVRRITPKGESRHEMESGQDPLDLIQAEMRQSTGLPGLPKFFGGAVGWLSYDVVRYFEKLPTDTVDDLNLDDMAMLFVESVVVFDHAKNLIRIVVLAPPTSEGYETAAAEIERIVARLKRPLPETPRQRGEIHPVESNFTKEEFEAVVRQSKEYIAAGDGFQLVMSQRLKTKIEAHPLTVYRALRSLNPSPYMFLLRLQDVDVVGASPEILVSLDKDRVANVRPIAGTRWRGASPEEDDRLEDELLADDKERAEHVMLVDLGRNDLGRVSEVGSVKVGDLMVVERYSHVMHIVSAVSSRLAEDKTVYDLIRACFPAGTVSGAPKVRAMEIIEELEPTRRGLYAGAVGYIGYDGAMDLSIAIRTILLKEGCGYVQAGAGLVYDSVPEREYEETLNKARAALRAIEMAQSGLET